MTNSRFNSEIESASSLLGSLNEALSSLHEFHSPSSKVYLLLREMAIDQVRKMFGPGEEGPREFPPFGAITFPFFSMGAISSIDLFGLDELIIFSFYWANRDRYRNVADIGANIGLHSIVLDRCGYEVRSYEPDPNHLAQLRSNLEANDSRRVRVVEAAVSVEVGRQEFVRVLGNTTGSHLAGSKPNPYGDLERFTVPVVAVGPIMEWADLLKLDIEGHEKDVLCATARRHWEGTDAIVEVGSEMNAADIFRHLDSQGVGMFAQKLGWRKVQSLDDMPTSYHDGSLFVSLRDAMLWG